MKCNALHYSVWVMISNYSQTQHVFCSHNTHTHKYHRDAERWWSETQYKRHGNVHCLSDHNANTLKHGQRWYGPPRESRFDANAIWLTSTANCNSTRIRVYARDLAQLNFVARRIWLNRMHFNVNIAEYMSLWVSFAISPSVEMHSVF